MQTKLHHNINLPKAFRIKYSRDAKFAESFFLRKHLAFFAVPV